MASKSKEEKQKEFEEKRRKREKDIAITKAQNEMLSHAIEVAREKYGEDSDDFSTLQKQINGAIDQNIEKATSLINATKEEIDNAQYKDASKFYVDKYNQLLEKKHMTDEEMRRKGDYKSTNKPTKTKKPKSEIEILMDKLKNITDKKENVNVMSVDTERTESDGLISDEEFDTYLEKRKVEDELFEQTMNNNIVKSDNKEVEEQKHEDISEAKSVVNVNSLYPDLNVENNKYCEDFDPRSIPDYVQYDYISLPSKGECYKNKKKMIPVRYMTAADENIIMSPNMYNNGSLIDTILERCILDKSIRVKDLCQGDRDAILVWLRATAYTPMFPLYLTHNNKDIRVEYDLSELKYLDFKLKGDENGYFDYTTNNGDKIKFKILTKGDNDTYATNMKNKFSTIIKNDINNDVDKLIDDISRVEDLKDTKEILETLSYVKKWSNEISNSDPVDYNKLFSDTITSQMISYTVSINGETNPNYIKGYIENMRSIDADAYRNYVDSNVPGVNFYVDIEIPESEGGGSVTTFLALDETLFINVRRV